jgi:uncharacterized membrane protein YesL
MKTSIMDATKIGQVTPTTTPSPLSIRVAKLLWEHMTLLLFASALLYLALLPLLAAWLFGLPLLIPWLASLTIGPLWQGISLAARALLKGEAVSWRTLLTLISRNWWRAVRIGIVPALLMSILLATYTMLQAYPHEHWLYVPLFCDGCLSTLALLASLTAFALPADHLRGWNRWKVALAVTRLQMAKQLALLLLFIVAGALLTLIVNASLLPLLCVPLVVYMEALTGQTCAPLIGEKGLSGQDG